MLLEAYEDLGAGDFDRRISVQRSDEFGELFDGFNAMAERLGYAEESTVPDDTAVPAQGSVVELVNDTPPDGTVMAKSVSFRG